MKRYSRWILTYECTVDERACIDRYTMEQYGTALLLVAGITVFVLGEVEVSPTFNVIGIGLILVREQFYFRVLTSSNRINSRQHQVGVGCDAVTSNFEERYFFKEMKCSHAEVRPCLISDAPARLAVSETLRLGLSGRSFATLP